MASLTYVCPKVSDESLGRDETYVCKASHNYLLSNSYTFFKLLIGRLCNWESLCDIRPDCHHHFDASGTSNAMFDELAQRSLMSPLAGMKHTYVRLATIIYCRILTLSQNKLLKLPFK